MVKFQVTASERRMIKHAEQAQRREVVRDIREYRTQFRAAKDALRNGHFKVAKEHARKAHWAVLDAADASIMGVKTITPKSGEAHVEPVGLINRLRHERVKRLQRRIEETALPKPREQ